MGSPPLLDHPASYAVVGGGKCTGPQPSGHRQVAPTIPLLPNTNSSPPRMDSPLPPPCHSFPRSTGSRCPIHPVKECCLRTQLIQVKQSNTYPTSAISDSGEGTQLIQVKQGDT
ncbi:hypothetical protein OPV22_009308 [Ensete ventricosum]|uniref:Uncharacterized protein n=1 Tax=Ensete ventricosum TaxID=4639 RepID=A0AAV8REQ6_ENSVE|nr:hypothetical protein OPV22_009308 [Ensete ventricosum]